MQLERPDINTRVEIVVVPEFPPEDPRASVVRTPHGSTGSNYRITFVLAIPGQESFRSALNLQTIMESGDSLLRVPHAGIGGVKVTVSNDTEQSEVLFTVDGAGILTRAQIRVRADNFAAAQEIAFDFVMPVLSWWSYRYDVAIDVAACELVDEQTDVHKWVVGVVGKVKTLDLRGNTSKPEFRAVLASYREGMNATNHFYQLLCFYRVIEGVRRLRSHRRKSILSGGGTFREPSNECIPELEQDLHITDPLVTDQFRPYLGKSFGWVLDQFRGLLRNAIAHLDPTGASGDSLIPDVFTDVVQCDEALPIIRYISRIMLKNELLADPEMAPAAP